MSDQELERMISNYDIVDALFRIHLRLYKVYSINVEQIRKTIQTSKLNLSFYGIAFSGFIALITYLIQVLNLSLASIPVVVFVILAAFPSYLLISGLISTVKAEKELDIMFKEISPELEKWTSYNLDRIAAYGTRLKIVDKIVKGANERLKNKPDDSDASNTIQSFAVIKNYLLEELNRIESENEEGKKKGERSGRDYEKIKLWLQNARRGTDK